MMAMRHTGLTMAITFGCAVFGAACARGEGGAADLPPDYRAQIVSLQLSQHANFRNLMIAYSDPVLVRVPGAGPGAPAREMTAVVYTYTPRAPDGSVYLMDVVGAALFEGGRLVRTASVDDPLVDWTGGQPRPHPDGLAERKAAAGRALADALQWDDPLAGPMLRRQIHRDLWLRYHRPIEELALPAATAASLWTLLEEREEAPRAARARAAGEKIDPFSGAQAKAVAEAKEAASGRIRALLGGPQTDELEHLEEAFAWETQISREEGLALADAGLPLSSAQLLALGRIYADVRSPQRNPSYGADLRDRNPATGLTGLDRKYLDRAAAVLGSGQQQVLAGYVADQAAEARSPAIPDGRDSSWLLHDPAYGPVFRREIRHLVLRDYDAAVLEMNLPPPESARVLDLLVARNLEPREAVYALEQQGLSGRGAKKKATDEATDRLRAVLGDDGYRRLEDLKLLIRVRSIVERDQAAQLAAEGCPLSAAQFEAVARAYWETHTVKNPDYMTMQKQVTDEATGLTAADDAFLARTAAIVSTQQQAIIRTFHCDAAILLGRGKKASRAQ